jgi:hypothetical protein
MSDYFPGHPVPKNLETTKAKPVNVIPSTTNVVPKPQTVNKISGSTNKAWGE